MEKKLKWLALITTVSLIGQTLILPAAAQQIANPNEEVSNGTTPSTDIQNKNDSPQSSSEDSPVQQKNPVESGNSNKTTPSTNINNENDSSQGSGEDSPVQQKSPMESGNSNETTPSTDIQNKNDSSQSSGEDSPVQQKSLLRAGTSNVPSLNVSDIANLDSTFYPPSGTLNPQCYFDQKGNSLNSSEGAKVLRFTDNNPKQHGAIWAKNSLNLNQPFSLEGYIYLGDSEGQAADGITITLQSNGGVDAYGGPKGKDLGIYGSRNNGKTINGLSLEFDTYDNKFWIEGVGVSGNHTGFSDTSTGNNINISNYNGYLSDGHWKKIKYTYEPGTFGRGTFKYVLSDLSGNPLASNQETIRLSKYFGSNYTNVNWGFTGSTGDYTATNAVAFSKIPNTSVDVNSSFIKKDGATIYSIEQGNDFELKTTVIPKGKINLNQLSFDLGKFKNAITLKDLNSQANQVSIKCNDKTYWGVYDESKNVVTVKFDKDFENLTNELTFTLSLHAQNQIENQTGNVRTTYQPYVSDGTSTNTSPGDVDFVDSQVTLTITPPPLSLTVPETINFGTYTLGDSLDKAKLLWNRNSGVFKVNDSSHSNNPWTINMTLKDPDNLGQYLRFDGSNFDNVTVTGAGDKDISEDWLHTGKGLSVDFSNASIAGKYSAQIICNLIPGEVSG